MMEKIATGVVALICTGALMWNSDVDAAVDKNLPQHAAKEYCSASSIQGSKKSKKRAESMAKELKNSMTSTPDMRLLAEIINILALIELQNLIVQCAILNELDRGI